MTDVEQAEAVVAEAQGEPRGFVRCSCPIGLRDEFASTLRLHTASPPRGDVRGVCHRPPPLRMERANRAEAGRGILYELFAALARARHARWLLIP